MRECYIHNYNKKIALNQGEWSYLAFSSKIEDVLWWQDLNMPPPSFSLIKRKTAVNVWVFPGHIISNRAIKYFAELKARIIHSAKLEGYHIENYEYLKAADIKFKTAYEARLISSNRYIRPLIQLRSYDEHLHITNALVDSLDIKADTDEKRKKLAKNKKVIKHLLSDAMFDYMRLNAYAFVKENSLEALTIDYLISIGELANEILGKRKSTADIKAKAKAIYRWMHKYYKSNKYQKKYNERELKMVRSELAKRTNEIRKLKTRNKVKTAVETLKLKNKKITIKNVMAESGLSVNPVRKYLKELRESGVI